ncbi:Uma2 family endonuclease [Microcoleus sp. PH2017_08_TRC_O_A]|uniref:Uma2 family endonuclease n=1 Tax=Microcoleus sp. PH2017_08_TRC_O_A TaxID=2798819 RepID=UPI001DB828BA|nr:Uma2 family endonuclease [Microcoleus sp. PH2017_08_TRC_O_A]MCC3455041.1 Uma2 family endonuclease [Microcoleus sp. PH2017_08_TRC_O_A]
MIQALPEFVTFDEFIDWYPENSEHHYELHNGEIVEMPKATGKHSKLTGFLVADLNFEIRRLQLPYFIPKESVIKPISEQSGYEPDIIVLSEQAIGNEPRWEKSSIITMGSSVPLIVEVTSTNWADDYARKLEAYESMGIQEYWIVDYLGLGGRRFIGNPKQPTFSVYQLIDGEYQVKQFRGAEVIESPTFPELNLTAQQVLAKGN